jgi:hypothetical protein
MFSAWEKNFQQRGGIMSKFLAVACVLWLALVGGGISLHADDGLDPLRDVKLDKHLTGPEVALGSLKGKVVFFEYWGFS